MSTLLHMLANHGLMLLGGVTALLIAGALLAISIRSPLLRQRIGELSMVATVVWVTLACIPMRRVELWHAVEIPQPIQPPLITSTPSAAPETLTIPPELLAKSTVERLQPAIAQPPPPAAVPLVATQRHLNAPKLAAHIFLIGAAFCIAWLMLGHLLLWRLIRRSSAAPASIARMLIPLSPGRNVRVLVSPSLSRPFTCGLLRPAILLPATLLDEQSDQQLRQVLLHELGHIQQKDVLGALIFNLALPLLYFHPLYWWLRRSSMLARELVVDDWAARADGKEAYVTQLIALARGRVGLSLSPVGSIGILQIRSHFYRRMHMLLHRNAPLSTRCSLGCRAAMTTIAIAIVAGLSCLLGVQPARAQDASAPLKLQKIKPQDPNNPDANPTDADPGISQSSQEQVIRNLITKRDTILEELKGMRTALGAEHPKVRQLKTMVDDLDAAIADQKKRLKDTPPPRPAPSAAGQLESRVSGVQLDVVNLANTTVDAWGAKRLAEVKYARLSKLRDTSVISAEELDIAKVNYETATKRLDVLKGIAAVALQSAEQDLKLIKTAYEQGMAGPQGIAEAEGRIKMLQMILNGAN